MELLLEEPSIQQEGNRIVVKLKKFVIHIALCLEGPNEFRRWTPANDRSSDLQAP
jgi:hypothetical protein